MRGPLTRDGAMKSNHPIDPVESARAIVLAAYDVDLTAERDIAHIVRTVCECVARYGDAFPVTARVRSLQQRDRP